MTRLTFTGPPAAELGSAVRDAVLAAAERVGPPVRSVRVAQAVSHIIDVAIDTHTAHSVLPRSESALHAFVAVADRYADDMAAEAEAAGQDAEAARRLAAITMHAIVRHMGDQAAVLA